MLGILKVSLLALIFFAVIDFVWLGLIAKNFYMAQLSSIGRYENGSLKPVLWAAGLVYILMTVALVFLVLPAVGPESSLITVFLKGALVGLVIYGVYDWTNYSTLKDFPLTLALADWSWGTFLFGIVAVLVHVSQGLLTRLGL